MRPSGSASMAARCVATSPRGRSKEWPREPPEAGKGTMGTQESEVTTVPEVQEAFEEIDVDAPLVGILMGSKNDKSKMQPAGEALQDAGIAFEVRVLSAHRDPEGVRDYCSNARMRGLKVIIAGAGM